MPQQQQQQHRTGGGAALSDVRAGDVMSTPIVTCQPDVPLDEVAELMRHHRIHAVVVLRDTGPAGDDIPWRVISELDLVRAASCDDGATTAGRVAASPLVTIGRDEPLQQAAIQMSEYETTHVIVVERGEPVGILSALDVAATLAPVAAPRASSAPPASAAPGAHPGDRLVIHGHHLGEAGRDAEILETRGPGGGPPFLVRWEDTGHVTLLYPGSDARVEHLAAEA